MCKYAKITETELQKIRRLESELERVYLLAVEKPPVPAKLSKDQLARLQALEKELNVRLVAYE